MIRSLRLREHAPHDREAWKKQYYAHQKQWQRRQLLAVKAVWDGLSLAEVSRQHHVRPQTLSDWLNSFCMVDLMRCSLDMKRPESSVYRRKDNVLCVLFYCINSLLITE
ncbi:MAG: hypothetical protein WCK96_16310 [Methylococcales bacterium]